MLNAHPDIALPPETHVVKNYLIPELLGKKAAADRETCLQVLASDDHLVRLPKDILQEIASRIADDADSYRALFSAISELYCERSNATMGGDKDTEYVNHIPQLSALFPGSFFVHIYRDPRDVISSRMKSSWGKNQFFIRHVFEYKYGLNNAVSEGREYYGERFVELSYEDLISDPEPVLRRICGKMGLAYSAKMLQYYDSAGDLVTKDEQSWKQNVTKPVLKKNAGKWKEHLTPHQARLVEYFLAGEMESNGYKSETSGAHTGPILLPLYPVFKRIKMRRRAE